MRIEVLPKSLAFNNIEDVFDIIPESIIQRLNIRLDIIFGHQTDNQKYHVGFAGNPLDDKLVTSVASVSKAFVDVDKWYNSKCEL